MQFYEEVEGAGWVEGARCEERDLGGVGWRRVFAGGVGGICGCGLGT